MSNFLAIAAVTETLRAELDTPVGAAVAGAHATSVRPDEVGANHVGVNVYLYQTAPNPHWRNESVPTRAADGALLQRPKAALDLHYLLTCHGSEAKHEPQRILGTVVRVLEASPVLTRAMVSAAVGAVNVLKLSDLADDLDVVRVTPLPLTLEELSKIWSVFFQTKYMLSVAYQASTVLIEGRETPMGAVPVAARGVASLPSIGPVITRVASQGPAAGAPVVTDLPVVLGDNLIVEGTDLRAAVTRLRIGESVFIPANVKSDRIVVDLAAELPAAEKVAGVKLVQVVHEVPLGTPPVAHRAVESNAVPFMLSPKITVIGHTLTSVTLSVTPGLAIGQRVVLLLNEKSASPAQAYAFEKVIDASSAGTTLTMTFSGVASSTYLVRLQVDGAESPLDVDTNPMSATFGLYTGTPQVTIP